ncbi:MAG: primosomal protein N' [Candidatus Margulisbacteria bacterium]|nr:primosomal protein N' [Candidatus Margulisiibacteriota bacterium]
MYAEVVLSKAAERIDKIYHYAIPERLLPKIKIGQAVAIPFGRRRETGYITGFVERAEVEQVREIEEIVSEQLLFNEHQVKLANWVAEYYCAFRLSALRLVMPPGKKNIKGLKTKTRKRQAEARAEGESLGPALTADQQMAVGRIVCSIEKSAGGTFLLFGVTGSGKTEVYMKSVQQALAQGKSSIIMVPEIALTPQLVQRFKARFGDGIALVHSDLTGAKRRREWERIASGEARIILGARSAIFAPAVNLGLVVVDEEYERSYKQDNAPRYHVREAANYLASLTGATIILGSATPSVETYYQSEKNNLVKLTLPKRIDSRPLPPVEIVDMRREKGGLLSKRLSDELRQTLERGEQAILFINRRGYFTYVQCRDCGFPLHCPHCSISLTYHSSEKKLLCNRCGFNTPPPPRCPQCNGHSLGYFGTGTQRIENEVADVFPAARILRYDRDSVSKRGSHESFFAVFAEGKADVLIGTQMVAKGLDVARVTLVGVVSADTALNLPDFRSAEYTFQLLTQVAGRAGRHNLPGKVIVQTHMPDHYSIQAAAKQDYGLFYRQEIVHRRELGYPPFSRLISLLFTGVEASRTMRAAEEVGRLIMAKKPDGILGPAPAVINKLHGEWRYRLLIKGEMEEGRAIVKKILKEYKPEGVHIAIDVDPLNLL